MSDDARRPDPTDIGHAPTVSPSAVPTTGLGDSSTPPLPDRIGRYQILGLLGEGGMGVVYEAEQPEPKRKVALKVIRGGAYVDETRLRLFQREAETLARLEHPNIAAIYESGRTEDGQHFFAMELVRGQTLHDYLRERPETVTPEELRGRLFLFRQIAGAVHYAHQRGVIHRDLKPANIIVTEDTSSRDASTSIAPLPAVKVLDFGLARITEGDIAATMTTEVGAIKGTLPYMSPEQARGRPEAIDLRTDVYALGVVLYEMLTGQLPYDVEKGGVPEALRVICEENPRPVSQIWSGARRLDPDVETIVGKALEKDADRRYQSAAELAADVERYLMSKPIEARPPSTIYQLRKFARRNRVLVGGVLATILALAAGVVVATYSMLQTREALEHSEASRFLMFADKEVQTDPTRALAYTIASLEKADSAEARTFALDLLWRGPTYYRMTWEGFEEPVTTASFSHDGEWVAINQQDGRTALWRPGDPPRFLGPTDGFTKAGHMRSLLASRSDFLFSMQSSAVLKWSFDGGELLRSFVYDFPGGDSPGQMPLHVSPDGDRLISVAWGGADPETHVLAWSGETERPVILGVFDGDPRVVPVADPTARLLAYVADDLIVLRSLESSTLGPVRTIGDHGGEQIIKLAFDQEGRHLASGDVNGGIRVWAVHTALDAPLHAFDGEGAVNWLGGLDFHPNGSILSSAHDGGRSYLWSLDVPEDFPPLELLHFKRDVVTNVAFHPNGRWMVATPGGPHAGILPLGRTYPRVLLREEIGKSFWYRGFAFSPDGTWVAANLLGRLRPIPLARSAGVGLVAFQDDAPVGGQFIVFDPAGRYLVVNGGKGRPHFVPLEGGKIRKLADQNQGPAVAVSRDGQLIAVLASKELLRVWDIETWEHRDLVVAYSSTLRDRLPGEPSVSDIKFTGDDQVIFSANENLYHWDLTPGDPELLAEGIIGADFTRRGFDLSPDDRYVLAVAPAPKGRVGDLEIFDLETGATLGLDAYSNSQPKFHPAAWTLDPTGTIVVVGGSDGILRVGRATGEEPHWLVGHEGMINAVAVSPDGQWILTSGADGTLRLWPMPDLDRTPLQALPHGELLARLRAQTNLRVVPDPESPGTYRYTWDDPDIQSWDEVPTW